MKAFTIFTLVLTLLVLLLPALAPAQDCSNLVWSTDPLTGFNVARLTSMPASVPNAAGHNLGYYRDVWNADESYMIIVKQYSQADADTQVWLMTGGGCQIKQLWTLAQYSWVVAWDMTDPAIVWTSAPGTLYKVNVNTTPPTFTPVYTVPNGAIVMDIFPISPTRLALATYDNQAITVNTDGTNPRFYPTSGVAEGAVMDRIFAVPGSSNQFAMLVKVNPDTPQETRYDATYDDSTSTLLHTFGPFHWGTPLEQHNTWDHEYFANGQAVYVNPMVINAGVMLYPIEMHIVNVDGTNDRMLYTSSSLTDWQNARSVHHWFGNTLGWYLLSLNPVIGSTYDGRYRDQFLKVDAATGSLTALGRNPTETISLQSDICGFWSLSLGNLNRRGDRINFNSCRSGATDNYILFLRGDAVRDTLR